MDGGFFSRLPAVWFHTHRTFSVEWCGFAKVRGPDATASSNIAIRTVTIHAACVMAESVLANPRRGLKLALDIIGNNFPY